MTSTLTYKQLVARIEFSAEDEVLIGRVAGINDTISFRAESVPKLVKAFHKAVDDYIEACAKAGKTPEKVYSGQIAVRIDPKVHAQAARAAELTGKSLTQWTEEALRVAANPDQAQPYPVPKPKSAVAPKSPIKTSKQPSALEILLAKKP